MENEADEIKRHIEVEREQLGRNFEEIEDRVRHATDVKEYFNENTGLILGSAVAAGFLLSFAFDKSANRRIADAGSHHPPAAAPLRKVPQQVSKHLHGINSTFDHILEGLVGVASEKLVSWVGERVPGFQNHYDANQQQRNRSRIYDVEETTFTPEQKFSAGE